jgi:YHS domain-containing protein
MGTVGYLLFWALVFFFMMRFGCGAHIMGHGHHGQNGQNPQTGDPLFRPSQAVDPVCGMSVTTAGAKTSFYQGRAYYFCSPTCRDKFEATPEQWTNRETSPAKQGEHHAA